MTLRSHRARTRIALAGAVAAAVFLTTLALGMRWLVRETTMRDIDEELDTLAVAIGSDFETEGYGYARQKALAAGLAANALEFRLTDHSAILFVGDRADAWTGDLIRSSPAAGLASLGRHTEHPFTAIEPYSGRGQISRFLVTPLEGKAAGATLVVFRSIEPAVRSLARLDEGLVGFVLAGIFGTAVILAAAVRRALGPVDDIALQAEQLNASDLSRRVAIRSGGEEFRRLAAVLNSLLERLESAFAAQRRLVADAAHELKTPAAVLVGEAQEAQREDASDDERRRSLEVLSTTAHSLGRQVDSLLQLSRGDARGDLRRIESVELGEIAEEAVLQTEPVGRARGVRLSVERQEDARLDGDRAALLSLASNLVRNAVQYTDKDTAVEVLTGSRADEVFLEVRDRGPGVPESDRASIFERFTRLPPGRLRNPEGSGLGLAIVDQVARRHGGRVEVEPRGGNGSLFRAVFPKRRAAGAA